MSTVPDRRDPEMPTRRKLLPRAGGRLASDDPERLLSPSMIAQKVGVTAETVRAWIRAERIKAIRTPSGHYRVRGAVLDALLAKIYAEDAEVADT